MSVIALAAIGVAVARITGGAPRAMMPPGAPLPSDMGGVYQLDNGDELTLYGTADRVTIEIDRALSFLRAASPDNFLGHDGTTVTVVRNSDDHVTGLELTADGTTSTAERIEPYSEEEVTFRTDDATLAGTLLSPLTAGPHPAIVIVHGAETATRETYRLLATHYARRGVAVLMYDKRGTGGSTGDVSSATFQQLTADALAGHALLQQRPEVDPARVGIAGFSQGGWIAALAAHENDEVAFVVGYSPSGFSPGDQHAWLYGNMLKVRGMAPRTIAAAERFQRTLYSTLDLVDSGYVAPFPHVPGFWFHALDHRQDTAGLWESIHQPVLGIWGANDCQVPAHDSATSLRGALDRGDNQRYTLRVLDGADHGLYQVGPCAHELGLHTDEMRLAPGYLEAGAEWIERLADDPPDREFESPPGPADPPLGWHQQPPVAAGWYGHATTQTTTLGVMILVFGSVALCSFVRAARRRTTSRHGRLTAATAITGLAAVLAGFGALAELAGLGATHATQIVGSGPVAGMPPLFIVAGLLVTLTAGLAAALVTSVLRQRATGVPPVRVRPVAAWATIGATVTLAAWATYWQLPWIPGGLL